MGAGIQIRLTMLRQAIARMSKEDLSRTAYIKARRSDTMAMMNRDLKKLFDAGFRYVFIDEVTLMRDFIDSAALFSVLAPVALFRPAVLVGRVGIGAVLRQADDRVGVGGVDVLPLALAFGYL